MFLCAVFHRLSLLFTLARFYFATAMDATCWGEDWPFSFLVLLAHLGTISCRRTLLDKSLARTLSLRWCFRMCDWTRCSAGFKVFFLALLLPFLSFLYSAISSMFLLCFRCAYFFTLFIRACCRVLHTFILNVSFVHVLQLFVCSCWTIFCYRRDLVLPRSSCSC